MPRPGIEPTTTGRPICHTASSVSTRLQCRHANHYTTKTRWWRRETRHPMQGNEMHLTQLPPLARAFRAANIVGRAPIVGTTPT